MIFAVSVTARFPSARAGPRCRGDMSEWSGSSVLSLAKRQVDHSHGGFVLRILLPTTGQPRRHRTCFLFCTSDPRRGVQVPCWWPNTLRKRSALHVHLEHNTSGNAERDRLLRHRVSPFQEHADGHCPLLVAPLGSTVFIGLAPRSSSTRPTPRAASRATAYAPTRCRSRSSASAPSRSCRTSRASPSRNSS